MFFIILLTLYGSALCCPNVKPTNKFNLTSYAKERWYEIARYKFFQLEKEADCVTYDFDSNKYDHTIHCIMRKVVNKTVFNVTAAIYPTEEVGKIIFYIEGSAVPNVTALALDTDNTNYVIFYNCIDDEANKSHIEVGWVVSRTPSLKPELKSVIVKYIKEANILKEDKLTWDHYTHEDCLIDV